MMPNSTKDLQDSLSQITYGTTYARLFMKQQGIVDRQVEFTKDLILAMIGEDEPGEWGGKYSIDPEKYAAQHGEPTNQNALAGGRNWLRTELRQKVSKL